MVASDGRGPRDEKHRHFIKRLFTKSAASVMRRQPPLRRVVTDLIPVGDMVAEPHGSGDRMARREPAAQPAERPASQPTAMPRAASAARYREIGIGLGLDRVPQELVDDAIKSTIEHLVAVSDLADADRVAHQMGTPAPLNACP